MSQFLTEVNFILSCEKVHCLTRAAKLHVPVEPEQISRAIQLLGNLIHQYRYTLTSPPLNPKRQRELRNLIGDLPATIEEARLWRSALRSIAINLKS